MVILVRATNSSLAWGDSRRSNQEQLSPRSSSALTCASVKLRRVLARVLGLQAERHSQQIDVDMSISSLRSMKPALQRARCSSRMRIRLG